MRRTGRLGASGRVLPRPPHLHRLSGTAATRPPRRPPRPSMDAGPGDRDPAVTSAHRLWTTRWTTSRVQRGTPRHRGAGHRTTTRPQAHPRRPRPRRGRAEDEHDLDEDDTQTRASAANTNTTAASSTTRREDDDEMASRRGAARRRRAQRRRAATRQDQRQQQYHELSLQLVARTDDDGNDVVGIASLDVGWP